MHGIVYSRQQDSMKYVDCSTVHAHLGRAQDSLAADSLVNCVMQKCASGHVNPSLRALSGIAAACLLRLCVAI